MRTYGVVDLFPLPQLAVELFHLQRAGRDLIELLGVGTLGPLDRAVEFRRTGRQHEQAQSTLLAGLLELSRELAAAIDLQGADREGHAVLQSIEELGGALGGSAGVSLDHIPAGKHVAGGELFEDHAGQGTHVERIDLHQIAGARDCVLLGFAHGIRTRTQGAARTGHARARGGSSSRPWRFIWGGMSPTIEVETWRCSRASRTTSLSLPQRGNCWRRASTRPARAGDQVGWRRRWGR